MLLTYVPWDYDTPQKEDCFDSVLTDQAHFVSRNNAREVDLIPHLHVSKKDGRDEHFWYLNDRSLPVTDDRPEF